MDMAYTVCVHNLNYTIDCHISAHSHTLPHIPLTIFPVSPIIWIIIVPIYHQSQQCEWPDEYYNITDQL